MRKFRVAGAAAVGVLALSLTFVWLSEGADEAAPEVAALAQCLSDKGVVMYGAYWCPHCANQKEMFASAWDAVSYVECAQPGNPRAQTKECQDADIEGYPTWVFPDGARLSGERQLAELAEKAGCPSFGP